MKKWLLTGVALICGWANATEGTLFGQVEELKKLQFQSGQKVSGFTTDSEPILAPVAVSRTRTATIKPFHRVQLGETLGSIGKQFGYDWRALCTFNQLANCHVIQAGATIRFPATTPETVVKMSSPRPMAERDDCINLGVAPFNRFLFPKLRLEGLDANPALTPEEKAEAKALVSSNRGVSGAITGDMVFKAMPFRSKDGKVKWVYNKKVCTPEQGGRLEPLRTWKLSTGTVIGDPLTCGNIGPVWIPPKKLPLSPPPVEVLPLPSAPPASTPVVDIPGTEPLEPDPLEVAPKEAVYRWDWELVVGQEHDRTSHSTHGSGAVYGFIVEDGGAEHAFGIGGTRSGWHGKTDTGFGFNGRLYGVGPAYKYSAYEGGWDFGLKLLPWASLTENGEAGAYQSHRQFDLRGITLAYNNYARELRGEKSFFKYQLFVSAYKPTGESEVGHSWEGKPISDTTGIQKLDHVLNVGGRLGLYDFSEEDDTIGAKLWLAGGWFQEAPSLAETANWRIQWSDKHERLFVGFGRNYDLLNGGSLLGFGWSWDIRKTVYVNREESRRAQFIAAIEKAGGRLDKDGMVILPKGMNSPQKQFKIAPSDD